jgi:hypothetical protein
MVAPIAVWSDIVYLFWIACMAVAGFVLVRQNHLIRIDRRYEFHTSTLLVGLRFTRLYRFSEVANKFVASDNQEVLRLSFCRVRARL